MARASSVSPVRFSGAKLASATAALALGLGLGGCHGSDDGHGSTAGGITTGGTELLPDTGTVAPTEVRMTWFGIANWTFRIGDLNILMDGYISRIPQDYFSGGGGGLAYTKAPDWNAALLAITGFALVGETCCTLAKNSSISFTGTEWE